MVKTPYRELLERLTPLEQACYRGGDCDLIRKCWAAYEAKLNECASELKASELSTGVHSRLKCYQDLLGWQERGYVDPKGIEGEIAAVRWWQRGVAKHEAELAHWRPLLVMESSGGPYFWGDAGWAIVLADYRKVAKGELGRLVFAVDVS